MEIQCDYCGEKQRFKYSAANVNSLIAFGWNSYGQKILCPECVRKWYNQNSTYLDGQHNTIKLIDSLAENLSKAAN